MSANPQTRRSSNTLAPTLWWAIRPLWVWRLIRLGVRSAWLAGLLALGEAYRILQREQADFFLVGGTESKMNPLSMVRQNLFQPLSRRNDEPEKASRPFDRGRDGWVIGEGSTVLAVEDLEHARRRGARIYAELVGFATGFDRGRTGAGLPLGPVGGRRSLLADHAVCHDGHSRPVCGGIPHPNAAVTGTGGRAVVAADQGLRRGRTAPAGAAGWT